LLRPGVPTNLSVPVSSRACEGVRQLKDEPVGCYSVASASIGLTLGVVQRSETMMFMTQESLE
jgi:hypothetical protein